MATPRDSGPTSLTGLPSIQTSPWSGSSTPAMSRSSTVFPQPDGPKTTMHWPRSTSSERPSSTFRLPNALVAFLTSR